MKVKTSRKRPLKPNNKPVRVSPIMELMGEDEAQEISGNLLDYCILLYGESGVGKTSVASKMPGSYIVQCDPNRKGLKIRQTLIENLTIKQMKKERPAMTPWEQAEQIIDLCCDDDSVQTVIIDNFGLFYEHCMRHRCYKLLIDDPSEQNDYGQTWRDIESELTTCLNKILYADKGLVLLSHATEKEIELGDGSTLERIEPSMMKAAFKWIKACTNFAFYMANEKDGSRSIHLRGSSDVWLKCCTDTDTPRFFSSDLSEPLDKIPAGRSPNEAWGNLQLAWDNELAVKKPAESGKMRNGSPLKKKETKKKIVKSS